MSAAGSREFTLYGPSHLTVLAVFVVVAAVLVGFGRGYGTTTSARRGERAGALVMVTLWLGILVYRLVVTWPDLADAAPLHLSDLVGLSAAYALWARRQWAFALTYYWGLVLSTQALVSPILRGPDFPARDFLVFWTNHLLVVWAAVYLTWGLRMCPGWRDYRRTIAVTAGWAAGTMVFNALAGTNYGFLNSKPTTPSLLDVLGPWPVYLLPEIALVLTVWALMTWPWTRSRTRDVPAR